MEEEKKQQGKRKEHKKNWQEVYATPEDIKQFLSERVMLRHNVVRGRTEIHVCNDIGDDLNVFARWTPSPTATRTRYGWRCRRCSLSV